MLCTVSVVMVEQSMKCEGEEIDSLDVFNQSGVEDVFLDSLEPNTYREKCVVSVRSYHISDKIKM